MLTLFEGAVMLSLSLSLSAQAPAPTQPSQPVATGFLYKTLSLGDQTYAYSVFVPPTYTHEKAWPVILFLHGSGERGTDGFLQTDVGIGRAIRHHQRWFPAIVVMPQCLPKQHWVGPMGHMALKCVEAVSREYHCDADRVYLTGLSMGGHGAWHIAASLPNHFAAVVPICGFASLDESPGLADQLAQRLKNIPIWCFHGDSDQSVPVTKAREMVAAIRNAGGTVQYTEFEGLGHNAWDRAYSNHKFWQWLFQQKRGQDDKTHDAHD